jgi:hypothetical protein
MSVDKFFRRDNMQVNFGKSANELLSLSIRIQSPAEGQTESLSAMANWIQYHNSYIHSPFNRIVKSANPFVQSRTEDYMLIEFWTKTEEDIDKFVYLLMGRFEFPEPSYD